MRKKNKQLTLKWQRLIDKGDTCPRCGSTENEIEKAVSALQQSLKPLGIEIILNKKELTIEEFKKNPLESNRILINNRPLEEYLDAQTGQSPCCDVCGPTDCRTLDVDGNTYETIPSELIIRAGLSAVMELLHSDEHSCCGNGGGCC